MIYNTINEESQKTNIELINFNEAKATPISYVYGAMQSKVPLANSTIFKKLS